jgi:hypothetical protein
MAVQDLMAATSRPFASRLVELDLSGFLFQSKQLTFTMQLQTQSNWCWAATSTSVSHYYWFRSSWTQCTVANAELGLAGCCMNPVPGQCNVPWFLDRALTRTNNFVSITGPETFAAVRDEIDAGRPIGARIGWSGGGGHFVCIYGYSWIVNEEYFDIDDPIYGKSHLLVADFSSNYQGSGTWTHTYFTKRAFILPIIPILIEEPLLRRIWDMRPLLALKQDINPEQARASATQTRGSLGLAQRVFVVGLDALTGEGDVTGRPVGLRVYETVDDVPRAFFDVDDGQDGQIRQMSAAEAHLKPFVRALERAVPLAESSERECELRLYRVPALNFEALWLSYEGGEGDYLIPLTAVGPLPAGESVPFTAAVQALREAARPLLEMDDTMGA